MGSIDVEGRTFTISSSTNISTMLVQSVFTISSSVVLGTSNYSCRATNEVGAMDSSMTQVFVYGKSYMISPYSDHTLSPSIHA